LIVKKNSLSLSLSLSQDRKKCMRENYEHACTPPPKSMHGALRGGSEPGEGALARAHTHTHRHTPCSLTDRRLRACRSLLEPHTRTR
jgi:hypothetical protein